MGKLKHWLLHRFKMAPCDLVEIVHEYTCPGFCFTSGIKQCDWHVVLRYRCCGRIETI